MTFLQSFLVPDEAQRLLDCVLFTYHYGYHHFYDYYYLYVCILIVFLLIVQLILLHNIAASFFFYSVASILQMQPLRSVGRSNFDKGRHNLTTLIQKLTYINESCYIV